MSCWLWCRTQEQNTDGAEVVRQSLLERIMGWNVASRLEQAESTMQVVENLRLRQTKDINKVATIPERFSSSNSFWLADWSTGKDWGQENVKPGPRSGDEFQLWRSISGRSTAQTVKKLDLCAKCVAGTTEPDSKKWKRPSLFDLSNLD